MLSVLILVPLIGAALIGFSPSGINGKFARGVALVFATIAFLWTIVLVIQFHPGEITQQFAESVLWVDVLGLNYNLGIDGLSLPLLVLNGLLTSIAIYSSDESLQRPKFYYSLILLLSAGVTGAFLAQDLLLFVLFYELELIPLYLLIAIWGGEKRGYAATKFLIYTAVSGILILASFLGMVWLSGSSNFALATLNTTTLPLATQLLLLAGILIGFGIKIPLVPFHTWLPDAHVEASTPISLLLAGVLLKLGTYGLLRFGMNLLPEAWAYLAPWLASWAVISVLYGASCAIAQTDMKKMVAYSSIGHMGYVLLATAAATPLSVLGAVMQMISHGLISAMLFLLVGVVYEKAGSRDLDVLQGLLNPERGMPVIGSLMVLGVMASAGIPGMVGFISEFIIFRGSFAVFPVQTLLSMLGTGLTAVYFLILLDRAFLGRLSAQVTNLPRVYWSDRAPAAILAVLIVIFGIQPAWLARWTEPTITAMVNSQNVVLAVSLDKAMGNGGLGIKDWGLGTGDERRFFLIGNTIFPVPSIQYPVPNILIPILFGEMVMVTIKKKAAHNPLAEYIERLQKGEALLPDSPENVLEVVGILKSYGVVLDAYSNNLNYIAEHQFLTFFPFFKYFNGEFSFQKLLRHWWHDRINFEYAEYCMKAMMWHGGGGLDTYLDTTEFKERAQAVIAAKFKNNPLVPGINQLFPDFLTEYLRVSAYYTGLGQFWRVMADMFLSLSDLYDQGEIKSIPEVVDHIKTALVANASNPITYAVKIRGEVYEIIPKSVGLTFLADTAIPYVEAVFFRGTPFHGTVSYNAQGYQIPPDQTRFQYGALYADPLPIGGAGIPPTLLMQDMRHYLPEYLHEIYRRSLRGEDDLRVQICISFQKSMFCVTTATILGLMPYPLDTKDPNEEKGNRVYLEKWMSRLETSRLLDVNR